MFDLRATLQKASEALTRGHIAHALIGGFALAFHGINRATADVAKRSDIIEALQAAGFTLRYEISGADHDNRRIP